MGYTERKEKKNHFLMPGDDKAAQPFRRLYIEKHHTSGYMQLAPRYQLLYMFFFLAICVLFCNKYFGLMVSHESAQFFSSIDFHSAGFRISEHFWSLRAPIVNWSCHPQVFLLYFYKMTLFHLTEK